MAEGRNKTWSHSKASIVGVFQEETKALGQINLIGVSDVNHTQQRISQVCCNHRHERGTLLPVVPTATEARYCITRARQHGTSQREKSH